MARQVALAGSFALALERARECAYKGEALALLEAWAKAELTDTRVKMTEAVLVKVRELAAEGWSAYMMAKNSMEWFGVRLGQTTIERHVEPIWVRQGIRNPDLRHKSRG